MADSWTTVTLRGKTATKTDGATSRWSKSKAGARSTRVSFEVRLNSWNKQPSESGTALNYQTKFVRAFDSLDQAMDFCRSAHRDRNQTHYVMSGTKSLHFFAHATSGSC